MKKLSKLKLNELSTAELNEREMCRLLGGGTPGCCQCGCNYANSGGSSTSANDSANNAGGKYSDAGAQPCCEKPEPPKPPKQPETFPNGCQDSCKWW